MPRVLNYLLAILGAIAVTMALWWLIAALFGYDSVIPQQQEPQGNVTLLDGRENPQLQCLEQTADLRARVTNSKYCEQDLDCVTVRSHGKSPSVFRCLVSVRRDVADLVQAAFDQHRSCDVMEDCQGRQGKAVCRENLCQLESHAGSDDAGSIDAGAEEGQGG